MASVETLTDSEIRSKLVSLGYPVGPITATTRKLFIKKLKQLLEQTQSEEETKPHRSSSRFSSGESSEDDSKPATRKKNMPPPKPTPVKSTRRRSTGRTSSKEENEPAPVTSDSFIASGESTINTPVESPCSTSFLNSTTASSRCSSLYGNFTSRRSLHPEAESGSKLYSTYSNYDNGIVTDNDYDLDVPNRSGYSSSRFSKVADGLTHPLSNLSQSSSFKSRFFNSKSSSNDDSPSITSSKGIASDKQVNYGISKSDDYDNKYASDFISSRMEAPYRGSKTFYSSRLGSSVFNRQGNLGLSNVKEIDDDDSVPSSMPHSTFNSRLRRDKWGALDSPWWKSSSLVSMSLVFILFCFFALIFVSYLNVKWKDATISAPDTNFPVCRRTEEKAGVDCIVDSDLRPLMDIFRKIYQELHDHVVRVKCEGSSKDSGLSLLQLSQQVIDNNSDMSIWQIEQQYGNLQVLINANPQWGVVMSKNKLDIPEPSLPVYCLMRNNVIFFVWFIIRLFLAGFLVYGIQRGVKWWMSRKDQHKKDVFRLVEKIIEMLSTHQLNSGGRENYLAIDHVRDQLIPPQQRCRMQSLWDDAVAYLESKESRVRTEVQQVAGEEFRVWRWLPAASPGNSRRKVWQGQAFETMEGSVNSLPVSPTPCLKIRHMFDPDVEVGDSWMTHVRNAILEKCEGINVLHVAVDKGSSEGCVYLKCSSPEEAGKAYRALHGSWFDSKLVTVKYLRLERYHERFPEAARTARPLRPTNNHKLSLQ